MEVTGLIKVIEPTQNVTASYRKRNLVLSTNEQFVQHILIEFGQDKCDVLDNYAVGQEVEVSINIRGREWTNPQGEVKYFNSIQGWKINKTAETPNNIEVVEAEELTGDEPF